MAAELEFITSNKNTKILVVNNHHYHKLRDGKVAVTWRCAYYKTKKCNAIATTVGNELVGQRNQHNHQFVAGKIAAKKIHHQVKMSANARTASAALAGMFIHSFRLNDFVQNRSLCCRKNFLIRMLEVFNFEINRNLVVSKLFITGN